MPGKQESQRVRARVIDIVSPVKLDNEANDGGNCRNSLSFPLFESVCGLPKESSSPSTTSFSGRALVYLNTSSIQWSTAPQKGPERTWLAEEQRRWSREADRSRVAIAAFVNGPRPSVHPRQAIGHR